MVCITFNESQVFVQYDEAMEMTLTKSYLINLDAFCIFCHLVLSRHLTHVGILMHSMMKLLVLWSARVRTGQKRKEREEVTYLICRRCCTKDIIVLLFSLNGFTKFLLISTYGLWPLIHSCMINLK